MKIKFNDATELQVQSVAVEDGNLQIKTISATLSELREKFSDKFACKRMELIEREQTVAVYENFTELCKMEIYNAGILGVVLCKKEETNNMRQEFVDAAVIVAKATAQNLSDQEALKVKILYDDWKELVKKVFVAEKAEFKFTHEDILYKTVNAGQRFQENWIPGKGTESLFTRIDEAHAGTKEDPIPAAANMEYEKGKYYNEDGKLYLMNRTGMADGEKIVLQFMPSVLVGQYFERVM